MPINENSLYVARFNMVMLPEERAMLQRLTEDAGKGAGKSVKESELIRGWIAEKYAERFGKRKPGEPVPKYNSAGVREAKAKARKK
jgi:hypothetical protein